MAANDPDGGSIETAIGVVQAGGKRLVCLKYFRPVTEILFEAQNAFELAEGLARAAYEARYGKPPPANEKNFGYLVQQIKARVTDELRNRLVQKHTFNIRSMMMQGKDPATIARETVDVLLGEVA